ncbi:CLUMA_CG009102, isoform A [Clunio marinus]|uniref:Carboxylic ester hydrolase n=1 Tax=Clunio marinus TaxID=568069 RepID=A0A1J1I7U1_9DIPT|nr:CLUMA_CG009102, isoform A [Clunio marinus]
MIKESDNFITISTGQGRIKGIHKISNLGRLYLSFQGIPYMKAPIGKLRYRDPEPAGKWTNVFDATNEPPSYCFYHTETSFKGGQEDAGVLNIYIPKTSSSTLLPVMVYIYGGGFQMGSSRTDFYGPDYFMQKDVVLVTFNYRQGPIGFLSLKDTALGVPGNAGLKDQLLALKWIKEEIEAFGGDPNNVTLFGDSAGGAMTHFHMISYQSENLFQKAIIMSGCAFNKTWSLVSQKDFPQRLGKKLGWDGNGGEKKLLELLEHADIYEIMKNSAATQILTNEEFSEFLYFAFTPVIEPYITKTTFIDKDPILMAREAWSKNIDCIIGGTSFEGAFSTIFERKSKFIEVFEDASYFTPLIELGLKIMDEDTLRYGTRIKKIYFEYAHLTNTNYELFCQYSTDRLFWHGLQNCVKSRVASDGKGKTFLYRFDVDTKLNVLKQYNKCDNLTGAIHGDTIFYLFSSIYLDPPEISSKEYEMITKMISLWTNFATTGNPNNPNNPKEQDWVHISNVKYPLNCLNISGKQIEMISLPESDRLMIWDTIYKDAKVQMF